MINLHNFRPRKIINLFMPIAFNPCHTAQASELNLMLVFPLQGNADLCVLDSRLSCLSASPKLPVIMFLGKTLYPHNASHLGVQMSTGKFDAEGN